MYIDLTYYKDVWSGVDPQDDVELQKLIDRSEDIIDMITRNRIVDFDNLHTLQKEAIQKATATQTEFLVLNGETYGDSESVSTAKIGSFSYSNNASNKTNNMSGSIAPNAKSYLAKTGLLYGGVANC